MSFWFWTPGDSFTRSSWYGRGLQWSLILVSYSAISSLSAQSNEGTEFWFAFMEHVDPLQNTMVVMLTAKATTTGRVDIPARGWSREVNVVADEVTLVTLPTFAETMGSESVTTTGVQVTSVEPVSVYMHQYAGARSEAAAVLPVDALGHEYFLLTYQGVQRRGTDYPSEMVIVATADHTKIEIVLSADTRQRRKGDTLSITLEPGQTYQIQGRRAGDDLTGTKVLADRPVAVFGGAVWTEVPTGCAARDNLLEQMYPIQTWGRQYVTVPSHGSSFDVFRIVASQDHTNVEVSDGSTFQLDAGEFVEYQITNRSTFIEASAPILVGQFNVGQTCNGYGIGDPSLVLLNSVEQTRDTVTLFNSSFQRIEENFINIVTRTIDIGVIALDGEAIAPSHFNLVNGRTGFSYAIIEVSNGTHTLTTDGCGVLATAYGYGPFESYAYGGGANFRPLDANPIPVGGCLSDTIFFDAGLSEQRYSFTWDLGDGNFSNEWKFTHQYDSLGIYHLSLYLYDQCLDLRDTLYQDLEITLRQALPAIADQQICEGDTLSLAAQDLPGAQYYWRGPGDFTSLDQFPLVPNVPLNLDGTFEVVGIISGCATHPQQTEIEVVPLPQPNLGQDTIICALVGDILLHPGNFNTYEWNFGSEDSQVQVSHPGVYSVEVSNTFGCTNADEIVLTERCPTQIFVPNAFTPNGDQVNDYLEVFAKDARALTLQIYDRWGALVFSTQEMNARWDGSNNGDPLPIGNYLWQLQFEGYNEKGEVIREVRAGVIHLLR